MVTDHPRSRGPDDGEPPEDNFREFLNLLNELKATGCSLLVVGKPSRRVFAHASKHLFGDTDVVRYRLLTTTDAPQESIANRLPDPGETSRALSETTHIINHAATPRSVTVSSDAATPRKLTGIPETRVVDPQLEGLQNAIVEGIQEFQNRAFRLKSGDIRVGIDSLLPLIDQYEEDVIRRCLHTVNHHVREVNGMAHYVLPKPYDSDAVKTFADDVDAIIELRSTNTTKDDHDAEERWHVPGQDITTEWTPL